VNEAQLKKVHDKLAMWQAQKRYGVIEVHYQCGVITHMKLLETEKMETPRSN
jgi:hypothetical protein